MAGSSRDRPPGDRLGSVAVQLFDLVMDRVWGHYALSSGVIARSLGLRPDDVVLDVGGGTGGVAARLCDSVRAIIVIEPSVGLTHRGRKRYPAVAFTVGDGRRLPVRDATADHVLLIEVLHHVEDADAVLDEAVRALRPDGSLLIEETEFHGAFGRVRRFVERTVFDGVWPRTRPELLARLSARGFRGEVLEPEGFVIVASRV